MTVPFGDRLLEIFEKSIARYFYLQKLINLLSLAENNFVTFSFTFFIG